MAETIQGSARESYNECSSIWQLLVKAFAGAQIFERDGLAVRWANNPFAFWNAVFLTDTLPDEFVMRERLRHASAWMRAQPEHGFLLLCSEYFGSLAAQLDRIMTEEKFAYAMPFRGMAGDVRRFPPAAAPAGLEMRRVTDDAMLDLYARLNCEAYGMPPSIAPGALSPVWREFYSYVGFVEGEPVCTAAAAPHEGSLYLGLVATKQESRKRGYAEAVIRHALEQARAATGITRTTLHATDAGYPTYERLGYETVAHLGVYQQA